MTKVNVYRYVIYISLGALASFNVSAESQCGSDVMMSQYTVGANDSIPASADSMSIKLTGRFIKANSNGKIVKACKDSDVRYQVVSDAGPVTCRINGVNVPQEGRMSLETGAKKIMCTDRPTGNDIDRIKIVAVD